MSSFIEDIPRTLIMNDEDFSEGDLRYLLSLFPDMDMAIIDKRSIRQDTVLQKAIASGAIVCNIVQTTGTTAQLSLTQDGRVLLGKI